jgi:propanol-preferring alcohol dehydrogenase
MILRRQRELLVEVDLPVAVLNPGQVRVRVEACAVCRTDLHVVDGELPQPKLPLVPGHEIVGEIVEVDPAACGIPVGSRVGIPWLGWTCGKCDYCSSGQENLCDEALFTGYTLDGGYAEYAVADARFCHPIPETYEPLAAAPLLCAGLIGYRCLRRAGDAARVGLYGFGAAAHLITQIARREGRQVFAFTRSGDADAQRFALGLGAVWAGASTEPPPEPLDAAIIFAPVGTLVPLALRAVRKAGRVICGGIHMSDLPAFPYELLWQERSLCSVANLTRRDGEEFFKIAQEAPLKVFSEPISLREANVALARLRNGDVRGALVLVP